MHRALVALLLASTGCGADAARDGGTKMPANEPKPTARSAPANEPKPTTNGALVTYKNGAPVGGERWRRDGDELVSEVTLGGRTSTVTLTLSSVRVTGGGAAAPVERAIATDEAALENGSWQAYALAGERFATAREPTPVNVVVPSSGAVVRGTIQVRSAEGGREIVVHAGPLAVEVSVGADGAVTRARVPAQGLEARGEGEPPPVAAAPVSRPPPEGIEETAFSAANGAVTLRGVVWRPVQARGPTPLAVILAGSGPTDRDGNSALGVRSDAYRQLAAALTARGIATLRYDKRGVGASGLAAGPAALTIDDFVADARAVVEEARADARFGKVTLVGHSEGGLVALLLAQRGAAKTRAPDALVLAATAGRRLSVVLREQLARQLSPALLAEVDRLLAASRRGEALSQVPPALARVFHPDVARFLASELELDPVKLLGAVSVPVAVVQGDKDLQVTVADAKLLAAARKGTALAIVPRANHLLKEEATAEAPQASYTDPARPLSSGAVEAIARAIAR